MLNQESHTVHVLPVRPIEIDLKILYFDRIIYFVTKNCIYAYNKTELIYSWDITTDPLYDITISRKFNNFLVISSDVFSKDTVSLYSLSLGENVLKLCRQFPRDVNKVFFFYCYLDVFLISVVNKHEIEVYKQTRKLRFDKTTYLNQKITVFM